MGKPHSSKPSHNAPPPEVTAARVPPHSAEAEAAVLGSVLLDGRAMDLVLDLIAPDDFYLEANRRIFETMSALYAGDHPIDTTSVFSALHNKQALEAVGGVHYVLSLTNRVPSASNVRYYANIVRDKSTLRRLIQLTAEVQEHAFNPVDDVSAFLDNVERDVFKLNKADTRADFTALRDVIKEAFHRIEQLTERKDKVTGVPSGFIDLDDMTAGFQPSDLIILAARPSMGKTALSLNMVAHAALRAKVPVAYFSLEMSKEQLAMRLLTSEAHVDASRLRSGFLHDGEWRRLIEAAGVLSETPIFIDDTPALPVLKMQAKCRRLKTEADIGVIVVDYLQLMRADLPGSTSREQIVSEISRSLKAIAKELNIPVIALSQLNRGVDSRTDKRPLLSDLRESGAIEQDADLIMFIYRDEVYHKEASEKKGIAEVIVAKQRNGAVGTVDLKWMPEFTRFENLARDDADPDF